MKNIMLATALLASCGAASAVEGYAGALIGLGQFSVACAGVTACDDKDTAFKLYAGSEFSPNVSVELGYTNFGESTGSLTPGIGAAFKTHAFSAAVAYRAKLTSSLAAVGRLGLASVAVKANPATGTQESEEKVQPYFGLGVDFALNKNVKIVGALEATTAEILDHRDRVFLLGVGAEVGF